MSAENPSNHPNFENDKIYHIYNRANGEAMLFYREENYSYLLEKYDEYLSKFLDTFAYCLLPNHFHFLVRPKASISHKNDIAIHELIAEHFRRFFYLFFSGDQQTGKQKWQLVSEEF